MGTDHHDDDRVFEMEDALAELRRAVEFFDRVNASSAAEKNAVGRDHWDWLEKAARRAAQLSK